MAQIAYVNAAASSSVGGAWTGAYTGLSDSSDNTYVESVTAPATNRVYYPLQDLADPLVHTGHTVYFRYQKSAAAGAQIDLTVGLSELLSTIASTTISDIGASWVDGSFTLTTTQAAAISDYSNLEVFFEANQV